MFRYNSARPILWLTALTVPVVSGLPARADEPKPGEKLARRGDEIVVSGQLFHTTAPVVLWIDPGGYDAYRVDRRFGPLDQAGWERLEGRSVKTPDRGTGCGRRGSPPSGWSGARGGGWDLRTLQKVVDQFVIHYDVAGTSQRCFQVLHDSAGPERPLHARPRRHDLPDPRPQGSRLARHDGQRPLGRHRDRQHGRLPRGRPTTRSRSGTPRATTATPASPSPAAPRKAASCDNPQADLRPSRRRAGRRRGPGAEARQYDLTPQQYDSLIKLTATLCTVFPKIKLRLPPRRRRARLVTPHADARRVQSATRACSATTTSRPTRPTPAPRSSGTR